MKRFIQATILAGALAVPAIQAGVVKGVPATAANGRGIQVTGAPEPATMFLLGSGLFAMGAVKVRSSLKARKNNKLV